MEIKTTFNIGDNRWLVQNNKAYCATIVYIGTASSMHDGRIFTDVRYTLNTTPETSLNDIGILNCTFESKQKLLESL